MEWFHRLKKRIRSFANSYGFTCDGCGCELFDYPTHRLCGRCEDGLRRNDGRTCPKCGRKTLAEGVCLSCKGRAPRFDRGISPFVYRGESASFVNRIKTGNPTLAVYFAEEMAETVLLIWEYPILLRRAKMACTVMAEMPVSVLSVANPAKADGDTSEGMKRTEFPVLLF